MEEASGGAFFFKAEEEDARSAVSLTGTNSFPAARRKADSISPVADVGAAKDTAEKMNESNLFPAGRISLLPSGIASFPQSVSKDESQRDELPIIWICDAIVKRARLPFVHERLFRRKAFVTDCGRGPRPRRQRPCGAPSNLIF